MMVQLRRLLLLTATVTVFIIGGIYFINIQSVPGRYSSWSGWSVCSKTCGEGLQGKIRKCNNPPPGPLGKLCSGPNVITRRCKDAPCPIDGGLSDWSDFGNCDKPCGRGVRKRVRTCTNPSPLFGGKKCEGAMEQTESCNVHKCPINGRFSKWSEFSKCQPEIANSANNSSTFCGPGIKVRRRKCNNPSPAFGGKQCEGAMSETHGCSVPCPTTPPTANTQHTYANNTKNVIGTTGPV